MIFESWEFANVSALYMPIIATGTFLIPLSISISSGLTNKYRHPSISKLMWRSRSAYGLVWSVILGTMAIIIHSLNLPAPVNYRGYWLIENSANCLLILTSAACFLFGIHFTGVIMIFHSEKMLIEFLTGLRTESILSHLWSEKKINIPNGDDKDLTKNVPETKAIAAFYLALSSTDEDLGFEIAGIKKLLLYLIVEQIGNNDFYFRLLRALRHNPNSLQSLRRFGVRLPIELYSSMETETGSEVDQWTRLWHLLKLCIEANDTESIHEFWSYSHTQLDLAASESWFWNNRFKIQQFHVHVLALLLSSKQYQTLNWCISFTTSYPSRVVLYPTETFLIARLAMSIESNQTLLPTAIFPDTQFGGINSWTAIESNSINVLAILLFLSSLTSECIVTFKAGTANHSPEDIIDLSKTLKTLIRRLKRLGHDKMLFSIVTNSHCNPEEISDKIEELSLEVSNYSDKLEQHAASLKENTPPDPQIIDELKLAISNEFNTLISAKPNNNYPKIFETNRFSFVIDKDMFSKTSRISYIYYDKTCAEYMHKYLWNEVIKTLNTHSPNPYYVDIPTLNQIIDSIPNSKSSIIAMMSGNTRLKTDSDSYGYKKAIDYISESFKLVNIQERPHIPGYFPLEIHLVHQDDLTLSFQALEIDNIDVYWGDQLDPEFLKNRQLIGRVNDMSQAVVFDVEINWTFRLTSEPRIYRLIPCELGESPSRTLPEQWPIQPSK